MYLAIKEAPWYKFNSKLHAHMVVLLALFQQRQEADMLMLATKAKQGPRQMANLYVAMIEFYGTYGLKDEAIATCKELQSLPIPAAEFLGYRSLLHAYASMDLPEEAEKTIGEMQRKGYEPSQDEYKAILFSQGRCQHFDSLENTVAGMESLGVLPDIVACNMILTTYATAQRHDKLKEWLGRMLAVNVFPSSRTLNALAKACPILNSVISMEKGAALLSADTLLEMLAARGASFGELQTVNTLLELCLLPDTVVWSPSYWSLDLHNIAAATAYAMLIRWLQEVSCRLRTGGIYPSEIVIVTGWGKHSEMRGKSSVRSMTLNLLASSESPFRLDRQNKGRLIARGHAVEAWLLQLFLAAPLSV